MKNTNFKIVTSKRRIDATSNGVLLIYLGLLYFTGMWWPGILLALWAWIGTRQFLAGRNYDLLISTIVLIGLFIVSYFNFKVEDIYLIPVLLVLGGIYLIVREYFFDGEDEGEDKAQEIEEDIADGKDKQ